MSLLLLFGGSGAAAAQAGYFSPVARFMGGAGAGPAQAGYFSPVARWMGGAGAVSGAAAYSFPVVAGVSRAMFSRTRTVAGARS